MAKRSKFTVREDYYSNPTSSHYSVDTALAKATKLGFKVYAETPFGIAFVHPEDAWKWGSKTQRMPYGWRES